VPRAEPQAISEISMASPEANFTLHVTAGPVSYTYPGGGGTKPLATETEIVLPPVLIDEMDVANMEGGSWDAEVTWSRGTAGRRTSRGRRPPARGAQKPSARRCARPGGPALDSPRWRALRPETYYASCMDTGRCVTDHVPLATLSPFPFAGSKIRRKWSSRRPGPQPAPPR
jgi:hypothetical protein